MQVTTRPGEEDVCLLSPLDRESRNERTTRFVLPAATPRKSVTNRHRPTKIPVKLSDLNDLLGGSTLAVRQQLSMRGSRRLLLGAGCGERAEDRQEVCGSGSGFPEERRTTEVNRA